MRKKIMVIGADGTLGAALRHAAAARGLAVMGTSRRPGGALLPLDLTAAQESWQLPEAVDTAFLLAGNTNMAACEADPEGTARINVEATLTLARRLAAQGAQVVVVSTNLVLSGRTPNAAPGEAPAPQNRYAAQKALVEAAMLAPEFPGPAAILRITKIAESLLPLLRGWAQSLRAGQQLRPFDDLVCAPMPLEAALAALLRIAETRASGLFHLGADLDLSYTEIARRLAATLGADPALVQGTTSLAACVKLPARPAHTTLDDVATRARLDLPPIGSEATLKALFAQIAAECTAG
ncbi:sugar nucleotide-binding protein [Sediminicoccus sp. KRV36]|uniref:sugar nucleotide-binding protein n=1 Tax=Sediminicoccus sp. KRV36 TaxID=3133721 RepID=UPI00200EE3F0|nr:sugar nucleotide-binding protein [Sediminicoccus rosea]UPY38179.1 sugar nucleotide-binding protein [Sediminicoccus rosea]